MDLINYTYKELEFKKEKLIEERTTIMNDCAKDNLSYSEFMEKARKVSEEIYIINKIIRLKQIPTMEYGKTWKGETLTIENFINDCKNGKYTDDDGFGYYATDNAKSDIIVYPSDFEDDYYRKDFTHIIWFNN